MRTWGQHLVVASEGGGYRCIHCSRHATSPQARTAMVKLSCRERPGFKPYTMGGWLGKDGTKPSSCAGIGRGGRWPQLRLVCPLQGGRTLHLLGLRAALPQVGGARGQTLPWGAAAAQVCARPPASPGWAGAESQRRPQGCEVPSWAHGHGSRAPNGGFRRRGIQQRTTQAGPSAPGVLG